MKKRHDFQLPPHHHKSEHEILKAVAQAWFNHHHNSNPSSDEFDARRRNFRGRPSRFRIEAIEKKKQKKKIKEGDNRKGSYWDFNQSLWDYYEIVAVSKRLEEGLVLDKAGFSGFCLEKEGSRGVGGNKSKESRHSLRDLINTVSSRRFNYPFLCS